MHHVVIVGGGFGGLNVAQGLRDAPVRITLIDRRNFHLFQPLLYQAATGQLSPANITSPLRAILKRQANAQVLLAEATGIEAGKRRLQLTDGELEYDTLVLATGARHHYFGHQEWEQLAPGLKTIEDATEIRGRVLLAFENAERERDPEKRKVWLTFVIIGGGPTGVELAGTLAELARYTLRGEFRNVDPTQARIILLEGGERVLASFVPSLSAKAEHALDRLGVTVWTNAQVTDLQPDAVVLTRQGQVERLPTHTVLWGAGVQASPLGKALARSTGVGLDRAGRVQVGPDLSVPGYPNIFVIGDLASFIQDGKQVPGVAPAAMQEGRYVAKLIKARLQNETSPPFHYHDKGSLATIGRNAAVADLGWLRFSGYFAWLAWLFIHLMYLVTFSNRALVLFQWAYNYVTRSRAARLITETRARDHFHDSPEGPRDAGTS